jgi:hypothetical protein
MPRALIVGAFAFALAACGTDSGIASPAGNGGATDGGGATGGSATGGSVGTDAGWPGGTGGGAGTSVASGGAAGAGGAAGGGGTAGGTGGTGAGCGAAPPVQCGTGGPCSFPQGVPDPAFVASACTYQDTDKAVDDAVNAVMGSLSGCGIGSDCTITTVGGSSVDEICQNWFAAVATELRNQGYCAGQHTEGHTDEIAVSNTCCEGKWYGYHICNYGGGKVVWNPGARRGWWMIEPSYCYP